MVPTLKTKAQTLAVALPLLALLVWTFSIAMRQGLAPASRIKLVAYDPTDLLSGHYLRFRYDFGSLNICSENANPPADRAKNQETCICVDEGADTTLEATLVTDCESVAVSCQQFVKGHCQYSSFLTDSERYYFPEEYASVLAVLPPKSEAEVAIGTDGSLAIKKIFVDSRPLLDFAKDELKRKKP